MGKFIFLFIVLIISTILCLIGILVAIFADKSKVAGILTSIISLLGVLGSWGNMKLDSPQILPLNSEIVREEPEVITIIPEKGWIDIYYTLDGTDPKGGIKYEEAILLTETTTVATRGKFLFWWSDLVKETYTFPDTGMIVPEHSSDENGTSSDLKGIADADAEPSEAVVESESDIYADDYLIKWSNSTLEKLVKNYLQKDNIYYSDIKDVTELIILGNDLLFFDDEETLYEHYNDNNEFDYFITKYYGSGENFTWKENKNSEEIIYPYGVLGDLSDLKAFTSIKRLYIYFQTELETSEIKNLSIHNLNLLNCNISDEEFQDIILIEDLKNLTISNSDLSNFDLRELNKLNELSALFLINCNIDDISFISELTNLNSLGLPMNKFTDIEGISYLTNLEWLMLGDNNINDITPLSNLKNLKFFSGYNTNITDWEPVAHVETVEKERQ